MTQTSLPIYALADDLVAACTIQSRLILTVPTGSGKSTQVPQILRDRGLLGDGTVVVLQPRRLAARLLAARVAEERGCPLGAEVGYQVRLDGKTSAATRILYVTEGILLRRLLTSPHLDGCQRSCSMSFTNAMSMATSPSPALACCRKRHG